MLTSEQVTKIEEGHYSEGWRDELCADWRTYEVIVKQLRLDNDGLRRVIIDLRVQIAELLGTGC